MISKQIIFIIETVLQISRPVAQYYRSIFLNILLHNSGNQSNSYIPFRINPGHHEADFILLSGKSGVIAAVGNRIDSDIKPYKDGALMNVCNGTDIFALNLTFLQIFYTGIAKDTFNIRFYRNVCNRGYGNACDAD